MSFNIRLVIEAGFEWSKSTSHANLNLQLNRWKCSKAEGGSTLEVQITKLSVLLNMCQLPIRESMSVQPKRSSWLDLNLLR
jgi:hypothetical protein